MATQERQNSQTSGDELILRVVESPEDPERVGQEISVAGTATLGRGDDCTVVIKDRAASRKHARIERVDGGFRVVDTGSANGVWSGGRQVSELPLASGTRFRIGETEFESVLPQPPPPPAPAVVAEEEEANEATVVAGDLVAVVLRVVKTGARLEPGRELRVAGVSATIGRGEDCDVVLLDDKAVSRRHARVELAPDGGWRVLDAGSANGVFVGERRVSESALRPGQQFRVGSTVFELVPPPGWQEQDSDRTITSAAIPTFIVRVLESQGGQAGKEFKVSQGFATLGRGDACTVVLRDTSASRVHARVLVEGERFRLVDNDSSNGVWVGEQRVSETVIDAGQRFRIGDSVLECVPEFVPRAEEEVEAATGIMAGFAELMAKTAAKRLEGEGDPIAVSGARTLLLDDPSQAYYLVGGKVEVFTVAVEDGKPVGNRNHFLTMQPGQLFFGMDLTFSGGSGFLAVGKTGSEVRRIPVDRLQQLAADPTLAEHLAGLVDRWIEGLSQRLTRDILPAPVADLSLQTDTEASLTPGKKARSAQGVVWLEVPSGSLLYVGLGQVSLDPQRPFPLTPRSWVELQADGSGPLSPALRKTAALIGQPSVWAGLDQFQQVLCEIEFINKRLAVVDEFQRLKSKAAQSEAARDAALDAIGAVLAGKIPEAREFGSPATLEPVYRACRIIGDYLGIAVRAHGETREERSFEENLQAVAAASRFRTRKVVLSGAWWEKEAGPVLAQVEATGAPVALIPSGARAYDWVEPSGLRQRVTPELGARLVPFGYSIYRPFPAGPLGVQQLMRFGARGLGRDFGLVVAMGVTVGVLGTATPYFTGQMIDSAIPQGETGLLLQFGLGMLVAALASAAFKITQAFGVVRISGKMDYSLQAALWDRLLDLPSAFFRRFGAGDLADRAQGINSIRSLISKTGVSGILGSISSVFYIFLMVYYSGPLAGVAILLSFVLVAFTTVANYRQLIHQRVESQMRGRISGMVLQLITGVAKVRVCAAENHAFRVWATRFSEQRRVSYKVGRVQNAVQVFSSAFPVLSSLGIFFTLYYLRTSAAASGGPDVSLSTGSFIAFNAAYGSFTTALQSLADASLDLLRIVPIYERLHPILEAKPETDESKLYPGRLQGEINISNVQFRYTDDGPWILRGVSLKVEPGEFVAFVGGSGCGKSTLMRLMLGFERPNTGAIYYDGQDMGTLDVRLVRSQMGVVLQESRVLPTDIYRNIVGTSARSMDEAWEAAEMAGLADDVREMPMGMHTVVSEGGGTFSGGQRQRLLIARAVVNKPRIIFLDEATSALDNRTQAIVSQSMERLDATRIVIAHRLSTVVNADKICYLDAGQIVEMGSYQELMKLNGKFAELARRQLA